MAAVRACAFAAAAKLRCKDKHLEIRSLLLKMMDFAFVMLVISGEKDWGYISPRWNENYVYLY